jgi:ribonuclease P protein subunit POP4
MPITPENIVRHELIGLCAKVEKSADPSLEKLAGKVVDESYNMLKIECKIKGEKTKEPKEKSIPKRNSIFIFAIPNGVKVKVDGRLLVGRPEDRIKKRFDRW